MHIQEEYYVSTYSATRWDSQCTEWEFQGWVTSHQQTLHSLVQSNDYKRMSLYWFIMGQIILSSLSFLDYRAQTLNPVWCHILVYESTKISQCISISLRWLTCDHNTVWIFNTLFARPFLLLPLLLLQNWLLKIDSKREYRIGMWKWILQVQAIMWIKTIMSWLIILFCAVEALK